MDEYRQFLAEQVIADDKVVTYRYLSRCMKVHVNIAKQMLYEFHKSQNAKKLGSVHATYLLYGTVHSEPSLQDEGDGDVEMTSSMPEAESLSEQAPTLTLSLVPEEQLNDVLQQYEDVTSIHVYSVGPHPMSDLQMIAETSHPDMQDMTEDAKPETRKTYGAITNAHAHRRQRGEGAPIPAVAQPTTVKADVKPALSKPASTAPKSDTSKDVKPSTKDTPSTAPVKKPTPSLKRGGSSGIMQAFAKGASAAKPKKETSKPATSSKAEDESSMALSDDGEDDSEVAPPRETTSENETGRQSRKEREEALRRMMDDDEDEEEEEEEEAEEKADTPMEEAEEPAEEPPAPVPAKEEASEVVSASTGDGRRRGKRRVMRKKQILDDQGYLVTIQEPGWESFSEDEPTSSAKSSQPTSTATGSQASSKPKKAGPKGSQGSIMSFFAKK